MASKVSWFGGHMARTVRELKVCNHESRFVELQMSSEQAVQTQVDACSPLDCKLSLQHAKFICMVQDRLKLVDMVLEVRDARIPFSSANPELERLVRQKRRLVVLNKADLAAPDKQQVGHFPSMATGSCSVHACVCTGAFSAGFPSSVCHDIDCSHAAT